MGTGNTRTRLGVTGNSNGRTVSHRAAAPMAECIDARSQCQAAVVSSGSVFVSADAWSWHTAVILLSCDVKY